MKTELELRRHCRPFRARRHVNQFYENFQFNILDDHDFIVHPESSYQLLYLYILHPTGKAFCTETNQSYSHKIAKCWEYLLVCCIFFWLHNTIRLLPLKGTKRINIVRNNNSVQNFFLLTLIVVSTLLESLLSM